MEGVQEAMNGVDALSKVSGFKAGEVKRIWEVVKENHDRLRACPKHEFVPISGDRLPVTFRTKYRCSACAGEIDAVAHEWYQRGIGHATWPNLVAPAKYENPAPGWEDPKLPDMQLIWKLAREVGYAVGIHGSLKRDFDLIAAPWTDEAVGHADLVAHLCAGLNAVRIGGPEHKPLGRVAVTLQIDGYIKPIDLSIMPRSQP
jgi:hypothetical protein